MKKGFITMLFMSLCVVLPLQVHSASGKQAGGEKQIKADACFDCHGQIKELRSMGKHGKVSCTSCHSGLAKHAENPVPETGPSQTPLGARAGSVTKRSMTVSRKWLTIVRPGTRRVNSPTGRPTPSGTS